MKKRKMYLLMVTASVMRRRSRMLIALLAVAIGAAILSGLMTIYFDVPRQMGAELRNYGANVIFTPANESFGEEDLAEGLSYIPENSLVGATPFRYETVRMHDMPVLAAGTDMTTLLSTSPYWSVEGEMPSVSGDILIGASVAENLALGVGDAVYISYAPEEAAAGDTGGAGNGDAGDEGEEDAGNAGKEDAEGAGDDEIVLDNEILAIVSGIVTTGGSEEDYIYMSMEDLETLTETGRSYDVAEVSVTAVSDQLGAYVEEITAGVDAIEASVVKRVTASETSVLSTLQGLVLIVTVLVLALTMVCVATTMTAVVTERRKEIGLRKAIGATDKSIIAEFMGEDILLGGIGGVLGAIIGFIFAQVVSVNVFGSSISFRPLLAVITVVVAVLITALTCILPVRSATSVEPALVLKGE